MRGGLTPSGRHPTNHAYLDRDYPGFPTRPFTWEEISAKFDKLAAGHVGAQLSRDIKDAVRSLEDVQVSDLTKLLREIN